MRNIQHLIILISFIVGLYSCSNQKKATNNDEQVRPNMEIHEITADIETEPVHTDEDAADDPCIWYNEKDPSKSRIIGTNKKSGLVVYDLNGNELHAYPIGRVNNVDIRYNFTLGEDTIDIVGATNRTHNSISLLKVIENGEMEALSIDEIISDTDEVYGFCFYHSRKNYKLYANLVSKSGTYEQYEISGNGSLISASLMRTFDVGGQCEGMVADDELENLFIGEEDHGVWVYKAEPDAGNDRQLLTDLSNINLKADIEGLTIYLAHNQHGYLLVSSQGNNTFAVFNRSGNFDYIGSFSIIDGDILDGTSDTDGIDVINLSMGLLFPEGFFIAQDGSNKNGEIDANQNFKVVSWNKIAGSFQPNLLIDSTFDFRGKPLFGKFLQ